MCISKFNAIIFLLGPNLPFFFKQRVQFKKQPQTRTTFIYKRHVYLIGSKRLLLCDSSNILIKCVCVCVCIISGEQESIKAITKGANGGSVIKS